MINEIGPVTWWYAASAKRDAQEQLKFIKHPIVCVIICISNFFSSSNTLSAGSRTQVLLWDKFLKRKREIKSKLKAMIARESAPNCLNKQYTSNFILT